MGVGRGGLAIRTASQRVLAPTSTWTLTLVQAKSIQSAVIEPKFPVPKAFDWVNTKALAGNCNDWHRATNKAWSIDPR